MKKNIESESTVKGSRLPASKAPLTKGEWEGGEAVQDVEMIMEVEGCWEGHRGNRI
jgi:hypothetical protein